MDDYNHSSISMTTFPLAKWVNMFDSEKQISDEIRYVMSRRDREYQMGNQLDRPSLLAHKHF